MRWTRRRGVKPRRGLAASGLLRKADLGHQGQVVRGLPSEGGGMNEEVIEGDAAAGADPIERQEGEGSGEGVVGGGRREDAVEGGQRAAVAVEPLVEVAGEDGGQGRQGSEDREDPGDLKPAVPAQEAKMGGADPDLPSVVEPKIHNEGASRLAAGEGEGGDPEGLGATGEDRVAVPAKEAPEGSGGAKRPEGVVGEDGGAGKTTVGLLEDEDPGFDLAYDGGDALGATAPVAADGLMDVPSRHTQEGVIALGGCSGHRPLYFFEGGEWPMWNRARPQAREGATRPAQDASDLATGRRIGVPSSVRFGQRMSLPLLGGYRPLLY